MSQESELQFRKSINKWTLSFNNQEIEENYRRRKWENVLLLIKVFILISIILHLYVRIKNAISASLKKDDRPRFIREIVYLSVSIGGILLEIIVHLTGKLKYIRGVIYLIVLLSISKDSYYIQYYKILPNEPLYGITLIHTIMFTVVICTFYCYSWISATVTLSIVAVLYTTYDYCLYDLGIYDKFYYPIIHFSSFFMIVVFVYNYERNQRYLEFIFTKAKKESKQLKNMFGQIPIGIIIIKKGILKFMNSTICRILQYGENIKDTLLKLKPENSNVNKENDLLPKLNELKCENDTSVSLKHLIEETSTQKVPLNLIRNCKKQEEVFELQIFDLILYNKKIKIYAIKELTDQFALSKEKAQREYKQKMVASFTHDMRNPITGIIGCLEMIKPFSNDLLFLDYLDSAMCSSQLLLSLVNDVLDMSRLEMNQLELNFDEVNIRDVINECIKIYRSNFKKKGIGLYSLVEEDTPEIIISDERRIMQILLNLISNAYKFTSKGYVKIKCNISKKNGKLMISVRDTGVGIASEDLPKLFKLFGKLERTHQINSGGIGIGLNFAKLLSNLLGGDIHVVSELGRGTKFIVILSLNSKEAKKKKEEEGEGEEERKKSVQSIDSREISLSTENKIHTDKIEQIKDNENGLNIETINNKKNYENEEIVMSDRPLVVTVDKLNLNKNYIQINNTDISLGSKSILYVDDEAPNHYILMNYAKKLSINLESAYSGTEAIQKCLDLNKKSKYGYRIIFMDINMPIMNGKEATNKIKKLMNESILPTCPIIGLSGNIEEIPEMNEVHIKPMPFDQFKKLMIKYHIL